MPHLSMKLTGFIFLLLLFCNKIRANVPNLLTYGNKRHFNTCLITSFLMFKSKFTRKLHKLYSRFACSLNFWYVRPVFGEDWHLRNRQYKLPFDSTHSTIYIGFCSCHIMKLTWVCYDLQYFPIVFTKLFKFFRTICGSKREWKSAESAPNFWIFTLSTLLWLTSFSKFCYMLS